MNSAAREARQLIGELRRVEFSPDVPVDPIFRRYVNLAIDPATPPNVADQLDPEELHQAHLLCSDGEAHMERYWARRITESIDPQATLREFPNLDTYRELIQNEVALIGQHLKKMGRVVFIGSGPLPFTLIDFARSPLFSEIVGFDADPVALKIGATVCKKLGVKATLVPGLAEDFDYSGFDVIFMAALVGMTSQEKTRILKDVLKTATAGSFVIARSVSGARRLIYPALTEVPEGLTKVVDHQATGHIVNSVVLFKVDNPK